jgi:hypothetical protein
LMTTPSISRPNEWPTDVSSSGSAMPAFLRGQMRSAPATR